MKIDELVRPGLLVVGLAGMAAAAPIGFAAGVVVTRDPQALRRGLRLIAHGVEQASMWAAQTREHVGDLWAEAREEAVVDVDAADFERAAAAGAAVHGAAPADAPATSATAPKAAAPAKKRAPRRRRSAAAERPPAAAK